MTILVTPLLLVVVGLLVWCLPTGKAQMPGLVAFGVGLLLLCEHVGTAIAIR